jgi:DNA-binding response OmpR family regulator
MTAQPPATILVVERDPLVRDLITLALERLGYQVSAAAEADEGLDLAGRPGQPPALVLVDWLLPRANGLMFMEALRGATPAARVPVIVLSALACSEVVQQAVAAGARDFILKPFDTDVLASKVRRVLGAANDQSPSH